MLTGEDALCSGLVVAVVVVARRSLVRRGLSVTVAGVVIALAGAAPAVAGPNRHGSPPPPTVAAAPVAIVGSLVGSGASLLREPLHPVRLARVALGSVEALRPARMPHPRHRPAAATTSRAAHTADRRFQAVTRRSNHAAEQSRVSIVPIGPSPIGRRPAVAQREQPPNVRLARGSSTALAGPPTTFWFFAVLLVLAGALARAAATARRGSAVRASRRR
jgi:hypothetical protein